jgi:GTP-binding protein
MWVNRVSHTPGRTQQINFFDVGGYFSLVDLPGYGYAKVSHNTRQSWEKLITYYLFNKRPNLINLLIDARRGLKENDIEVADMIVENRVNMQIVFTKCDEIKNCEILQSNTCAFLKARYNIDIKVLFTSARNRDGASELQNSFYTHIGASP